MRYALQKEHSPSLEAVLTEDSLFYRTFRPIGGQPGLALPCPVASELQRLLPNWERSDSWVIWDFNDWQQFRQTAISRLRSAAPVEMQPRATQASITSPPIELLELIQQSMTPRSAPQAPTISINIRDSFNSITTETNSRNYTGSRQLRYHQVQAPQRRSLRPGKIAGPFFFGVWLATCMMILMVGGIGK